MTIPRLWQSAIMTIALGIAAGTAASADAPTTFDEHTLYSLSPQAAHGGFSLDVHRDGTRVHLAPTHDAPNQLWHIRRSDRGTWVFGSVMTGACVRLSAAGYGTDARIEMHQKDRSRAQNWIVRPSADRQFVRIVSELRGPQVSLGAAGGPGQDGVGLIESLPTPFQRWSVTAVRHVPETGKCDSF